MEVRGRRDWAKRKKGLMDMDHCGVIAGIMGVRGLNGNGKNTIKMFKMYLSLKLSIVTNKYYFQLIMLPH